jgi:hypothetical protein
MVSIVVNSYAYVRQLWITGQATLVRLFGVILLRGKDLVTFDLAPDLTVEAAASLIKSRRDRNLSLLFITIAS